MDHPDDQVLILSIYKKQARLIWFEIRKHCSEKDFWEDILQDVVFRLIEKADRLGQLDEEYRTAYVAVTARNTAISYIQQMQRKQQHEVPFNDNEIPEDETGPDNI